MARWKVIGSVVAIVAASLVSGVVGTAVRADALDFGGGGTIDSGSPTISARPALSGTSSSCLSTPSYPGTVSGAFHYDGGQTSTETPGSCMVITLTSATVGNGVEMAAYSSFDPSNVAAGYIGGSGSAVNSTNTPVSFSFRVPASGTFTLVAWGLDDSDFYTFAAKNGFPVHVTVTPSTTNPTGNQLVTFTVTLTPLVDAGPVTGTVTLLEDLFSPVATVPVGPSGTVTFQSVVGVGVHQFMARYSGDLNYDSSTSTLVTESVACTRTITGSVSSLVISSGVTCLDGATVTGSVVVARGASLSLVDSTVGGTVTANGAAGVMMCGSTTGAVTLTATTGVVNLGYSVPTECAGNTINGSLVVSNTGGGGARVEFNTITGSRTFTGNVSLIAGQNTH